MKLAPCSWCGKARGHAPTCGRSARCQNSREHVLRSRSFEEGRGIFSHAPECRVCKLLDLAAAVDKRHRPRWAGDADFRRRSNAWDERFFLSREEWRDLQSDKSVDIGLGVKGFDMLIAPDGRGYELAVGHDSRAWFVVEYIQRLRRRAAYVADAIPAEWVSRQHVSVPILDELYDAFTGERHGTVYLEGHVLIDDEWVDWTGNGRFDPEDTAPREHEYSRTTTADP